MSLPPNLANYAHGLHTSIHKKVSGRSATGSVDMRRVARALYSIHDQVPNNPSSAFLDIGTLFGASAIYFKWLLDEMGLDKITVITVDPMNGYYGDRGAEPCPSTVFRNLELFDCLNGVRVLKGSSSDPEIIERVEIYNLFGVFIDGDHSYKGVQLDWINYGENRTSPYVVAFHDYEERSWVVERTQGRIAIDVKQFVDENIVGLEDWIHMPIDNTITYVIYK